MAEGDAGFAAFWHSKRWVLLGGLLVAAVHLGLTQYYLPASLVFGSEPIQGDDFDVHIGQTWRVVEGLEGWGRSWVYDPKLLAGQPEGTIFDGDNKGWELWTYAFKQLGLTQAVAFNSFVLAAFLGCPLLAWICARWFGFSSGASVVAAGFFSCAWFFDSFAHWVWWIGMVEYGIAGCFALFPLALFYRFTRERSWWLAAGCAVSLGAAHVLHPYSFFILAVPMAALYLRAARGFAPREHAWVVAIVVCTVVMNLYWLLPAFAHWHYILDSGFYAQSGPRFLIADFFDILLDPSDTGVIGTRAGFRFLFLAMSVAAMLAWRKTRDPRLLPLACVIGVCFAFSYLGPLIPYARQIQPYRHALPLCFTAALVAAGCVEWMVAERTLRGLSTPVYALLAILTLGVVRDLGIQIAYFTPHLVPETAPLFGGAPSPIVRYGFYNTYQEDTHLFYGLPHTPGVEAGTDDVIDWMDNNLPRRARVLIDNIQIGERVAWKTSLEVMGGFELRNIAHAHANFFRMYGTRMRSAQVIDRYLRTYAISYTVLQAPRDDFAAATSVVEELPDLYGRKLYKTRAPVSVVLEGTGKVLASTNRIAVSGSDPARDVVLSYHWHEQLECIPKCRVLREKVPLDRVGFIRVPAPHGESFVIRLRY